MVRHWALSSIYEYQALPRFFHGLSKPLDRTTRLHSRQAAKIGALLPEAGRSSRGYHDEYQLNMHDSANDHCSWQPDNATNWCNSAYPMVATWQLESNLNPWGLLECRTCHITLKTVETPRPKPSTRYWSQIPMRFESSNVKVILEQVQYLVGMLNARNRLEIKYANLGLWKYMG